MPCFAKIRAPTWEMLQDLQRVHDLDLARQTARRLPDGEYEVDGLLSEEQTERLRQDGFQVEITSDAGEVAAQRLKELGSKAG